MISPIRLPDDETRQIIEINRRANEAKLLQWVGWLESRTPEDHLAERRFYEGCFRLEAYLSGMRRAHELRLKDLKTPPKDKLLVGRMASA
jgi:hypothetical protein